MSDIRQLHHQEIVRKLLDSKAVDFDAIGKAVSEIGPSLALSNEPGDGFCGTMRSFIRLYRLPGLTAGRLVEQLPALGSISSELG
jgi:hypothetical protein